MRKIAQTLTTNTLLIARLCFFLRGAEADYTKPPAKSVTFTKDVAPILFKSCAETQSLESASANKPSGASQK